MLLLTSVEIKQCARHPTFLCAALGPCRQRADHLPMSSRVAKPEADVLQINMTQTPLVSRGFQQTALNLRLLHSDHQSKWIDASL